MRRGVKYLAKTLSVLKTQSVLVKTQSVLVKTQCVFKSVFIFPLIYVSLENISAMSPIYVLFSKYEDSFVFQVRSTEALRHSPSLIHTAD